jgi:NADH:ubiquinone oxidoreductase subunit 6 (subunit J)
MFKGLSVTAIIGAVVFAVMFLFSWIGSNSGGFSAALPHLLNMAICVIAAVFFSLLNYLQETVEKQEKQIKTLQEDLHKLEDKVKNIK